MDNKQAGSIRQFLECVQTLDPGLVLLFGSLATGDYTQYSDVDVLVVFDRHVDWLEVYSCSDGIVQPVVKTWAELIDQINQGEPFYLQMLKEGVTLFEAGDQFTNLKSQILPESLDNSQ